MTQNEFIPVDTFDEEKKYWFEKLSGQLTDARLAGDSPGSGEYLEAKYNIVFGEEIDGHLARVGKNNDLSLFVILLSAFKIFLTRYTGQEEIIVASPTYGSRSKEYNRNVVFRDFLTPGMTFKDVLLAVKQTVAGGYKNQYFPLKQLIQLLGLPKGCSLSRFILLYENIHDKESALQLRELYENDLIISLRKSSGSMEADFIYNAKLFNESTIRRLALVYSRIIRQVLTQTGIVISEIPLLSEEEREEILVAFNRTSHPVEDGESRPGTLHRLFEEQAERFPGNIAVSLAREAGGHPDEEILFDTVTYEELNRRANRVARYLNQKGACPGTIVAVIMHDHISIAVAILGILKAGAAYLPIARDFPPERKDYLLKDSDAVVALVDSSPADDPGEGLDVPCVISLEEPEISRFDSANLEHSGSSSDPAYVIFTSGTTGTPKGVLVEHKGVMNFISWRLRFYDITSSDVSLQLLSYTFDGFGANFYIPLLSGGKMVAVHDSMRLDYQFVNKVATAQAVTNMAVVPGMYEALLDTAGPGDMAGLRSVTLAGEKSGIHLLQKSLERCPNLRISNEYGPTEGSIAAAAMPEINVENPAVIGTPISNLRIYILGSRLEVLPIGVTGELYIGGAGVAAGYVNRPELTRQAFLDDPFNEGQRMYRTGDLGRWMGDGNIEFLGRADYQVKIRGFRIELEEINRQLLKHEKVKEAFVTAREDDGSEKYLAAYIIPGSDHAFDDDSQMEEQLKEFLARSLPDYMVPPYIISIPKIPLTPNGKTDLDALPVPDTGSGTRFTAPGGDIQEKLAEIFADVLNREKDGIGIDHNFFHLGGHSLRATILVARIHQAFDVKIPLEDIFKLNTVRQLAQYIKESEKEEFSAVEAVEKREYYPLASAQKRYYIMEQLNADSMSYHVPLAMQLDGPLDKEQMQSVFKQLILRHESLRTSFRTVGDDVVQVIHDDAPFEIAYHDISSGGQSLENIMARFMAAFDLSRAPLFRCCIVKTGQDSHALLIDMHHIITDGISLKVMIADFSALYNNQPLSEIDIHYKDYAVWQNRLVEAGRLEKQEAYWLERFKGEIPVLNMPTDFSSPQAAADEGDSFLVPLEPQLCTAIEDFVVDTDTTVNIMVLACYNIVLAKYTGQDDIIVGSITTGRNHVSLENIIGLFTNSLAIRNYPRENKTFREFLREVKDNVIDAYENQDYQFNDLVWKLGIQNESDRNPLFNTLLTFQNLEIPEIRLPQLNLKPLDLVEPATKFDLYLDVFHTPGSIGIQVKYAAALYKKSTIERFMQHYTQVIEQVVNQPRVLLKDITISLDSAEIQTNRFKEDDEDFGF